MKRHQLDVATPDDWSRSRDIVNAWRRRKEPFQVVAARGAAFLVNLRTDNFVIRGDQATYASGLRLSFKPPENVSLALACTSLTLPEYTGDGWVDAFYFKSKSVGYAVAIGQTVLERLMLANDAQRIKQHPQTQPQAFCTMLERATGL